jgi:hypothetical protein
MKTKIAIAIACGSLWLYFVLTHQSPVDRMVDFLKEILTGLGVYHAVLKNPTTPSDDDIKKQQEAKSTDDNPPKDAP